MRPKQLAILMLPLLACACEVKVGKPDADNGASVSVGEDGNVAIKSGSDGVSINTPGFNAKVAIPGLEMGGDHMDIDGIKLYPGTKLAAVNVTGKPDNGNVEMRFTSAAAPAALAQYYSDSAKAHEFTDIKLTNTNGTSALMATKPDGDILQILMNPDGKGGTAGQIQVTDGGDD